MALSSMTQNQCSGSLTEIQTSTKHISSVVYNSDPAAYNLFDRLTTIWTQSNLSGCSFGQCHIEGKNCNGDVNIPSGV